MLRCVGIAGVGILGLRYVAEAQTQPRIIAIKARKFTYEPDVVVVKLQESVILRLTTDDVVMGFSLPDFGVRATIIPGQVIDLPLTPTKAGEFVFVCDVFCGTGHENMDGTLRVVA